MELRVGTSVVGPGGRPYRVARIDKFNPNHDERGRFSEAPGGSIVAFHGTVDSVVEEIKRDGFRALKIKSDAGVTTRSDLRAYDDYRDYSVHVASTLGDARAYADMRLKSTTGKAVIFELRIPRDEWRAFNEDRQHWSPGRAAYTQKTIPPEWIVGSRAYTHRDVGGRLVKRRSTIKGYVTAFAVILVDESEDGEVDKAFDPSQPRDEDGKWTSGGGGLSLADIKAGKTYTGADLFDGQGDANYIFHGTSSVSADAIEKDGIGGGGSSTYVTTSLSVASEEAQIAVSGESDPDDLGDLGGLGTGGEPVILAIDKHHPAVREAQWTVDHEFGVIGDHGINAFGRNRIPPAAIRRLTLAQAKALGVREVYKFDPSQPRARDGKWTSGGGGHGGGKLSAKEEQAIWDWVGVDAESSLETSPEFERALLKLPVHSGEVYRGEALDRPTADAYTVGDILEIKGPMPASREYAEAKWRTGPDSAHTPVLMVIQAKTSRDLGQFNPDEAEVLFTYGTRLKIDRVKSHVFNYGPPAWGGADMIQTGRKIYLSEIAPLKKFDPGQPRDERGRWSSGGLGGNVPAYLSMVAGMHPSGTDAFILEHGRGFPTDSGTYVGGTPHECYKNSTLAVMSDDSLTYVEGYVDVHGVPIKHAWAIDTWDRPSGVVRDYTLRDGRGIRGYFGVPIKRDYMLRAVLEAKVYGVLTHNQTRRLAAADPAEVVAR